MADICNAKAILQNGDFSEPKHMQPEAVKLFRTVARAVKQPSSHWVDTHSNGVQSFNLLPDMVRVVEVLEGVAPACSQIDENAELKLLPSGTDAAVGQCVQLAQAVFAVHPLKTKMCSLVLSMDTLKVSV